MEELYNTPGHCLDTQSNHSTATGTGQPVEWSVGGEWPEVSETGTGQPVKWSVGGEWPLARGKSTREWQPIDTGQPVEWSV